MSPGTRKKAGLTLAGMLAAVAFAAGCASLRGDWRTAGHEPVGSAPDPAVVREAVVQVYAARAFGWRGTFVAGASILCIRTTQARCCTALRRHGWRGWAA